VQTLSLSSVTLISLLIGVAVGKNSIRSGQYFINALVGTAAFGALMYGGFTWYDETFLFGFLGCMLFNQIKFPIKSLFDRQKIYFLFLIYFLFEFVNAIYFFHNNNEDVIRKFRWLIFLLLLLLLATLGKLDKNKNFVVTVIHLWTIVLFLTVYLLSNYIVLLKTGSAGYAQYAQVPERGYIDAIWANTAYVTLSLFIFMYVAMIGLIQKYSKMNINLSRLVLLMVSFIFGLTLSRGGFFLSALLLGSFFISQRGWKNLISSFLMLSMITAAMIIGLNASGKGNLETFGRDIRGTVEVLLDENRTTGRESDRIKQYTQLTEVITSSSTDSQGSSSSTDSQGSSSSTDSQGSSSSADSQISRLWHFLLGHGIRTSGNVLALANGDSDQSKYSMSFAPSIPIEFGFIGFVLFLLTIFEGIKNLFWSKSKNKLMVITLVSGAVLTTLVVNNFDFIPLYILIGSARHLSSSYSKKD